MQTIRSLLEPIVRAHRLESGLLSLRLQSQWRDLVGPQIAAHSHPVEIRRDTLTVVVDSPVWSQELSLLKDELIRRVNSLRERPFLRQIRFRIGEIPASSPRKPDLPAPSIDPSDLSGAEALAEGLSDPDLKNRMKKILRRTLGR
jgi:predicted nucleic acid-binding Zn ribbon protein